MSKTSDAETNNSSYNCPKDLKCTDSKCRRYHSTHSGISPNAKCQFKPCTNHQCIFFHSGTADGSSPAHNKNKPVADESKGYCKTGPFGTKCENDECALKHKKLCFKDFLCIDPECNFFHVSGKDGNSDGLTYINDLKSAILNEDMAYLVEFAKDIVNLVENR